MTQIMEKYTSVIKESEEISMGLVHLKRHQNVMEAINNNKPLIPKVKVSAQDLNQQVEDTISEILTSVGLNICKALQDHYESVFAEKQMDNVSVNLKLETLVQTRREFSSTLMKKCNSSKTKLANAKPHKEAAS